MKRLLLMHKRHTPDDADIWRVAINQGWNVERTDFHQVEDHCKGYDPHYIKYYGNVFHADLIKPKLPIVLWGIPENILPNLKQFTHRTIETIRYQSLHQPLKERCFVKPVNQKWFESKVYNEGENISGSPTDDDLIYVSKVVEFIDEVRCFVVDGKILTSSLYKVAKQPWDITGLSDRLNFDDRINDTPIPEYVREIHQTRIQGSILPFGIVMDFGLLPNGDWALIEFNEAWASGLYYCNPEACFETIKASQIV